MTDIFKGVNSSQVLRKTFKKLKENQESVMNKAVYFFSFSTNT